MKTEEQQVKQERFRIKPDTLDAFISTCDDDEFCGRILRAIGGQKVKLEESERWLVIMIRKDLELMHKRYEDRKEAQRIRQAEWRKRMANATNKYG